MPEVNEPVRSHVVSGFLPGSPKAPQASAPAQSLAPTEHLPAKPHNTPLLTPEQWAEAEAMYMTGATPIEIGRHFNLEARQLSARVTRGGWAQKRATLNRAADKLAASQLSETRANTQAKLISDMTEVIEQGVEVLKTDKPRTRKQVKQHFEAAQAIMEVAKPIMGIGEDSGGKQIFNLSFLASPGQHVRVVGPAEPETLDLPPVSS